MTQTPFDGLSLESVDRGSRSQKKSQRDLAVVNSALWAAWADACGWITELTDESGLLRRTGKSEVLGCMPWKRLVGGRGGVRTILPEGTYSDDTQLRLSVGRSYGSTGFDVETFSKVELPVWTAYALGGGRGTKAAAQSMARNDSRWSANRPEGYYDFGGNGAAMRAQPHAWFAVRSPGRLMADVARDAVSTHGHPRGIIGAAMSALAVEDALPSGERRLLSDSHDYMMDILSRGRLIKKAISADEELSAFWVPHWTNGGKGWDETFDLVLAEVRAQVDLARTIISQSSSLIEGYRRIIGSFDLKEPGRRGSGTLTVLAALAACRLAVMHGETTEKTILTIVNELGTDTDTIATMAGAILGAAYSEEIPSPVQDSRYIESEALRVSRGRSSGYRFTYPDILHWTPPRSQSDALFGTPDGFIVSGLGRGTPLLPPEKAGTSGFGWQWIQLDFGQSVFIKRRAQLPEPPKIETSQLLERSSNGSLPPAGGSPVSGETRKRAAVDDVESKIRPEPVADFVAEKDVVGGSMQLEMAIRKTRASNFDVRVIGIQLARLAREVGPSFAAAFGAVIADELARPKSRDSG